MFVVMNRLSNANVVEAVCADFQMELTDQFLLYRNDKHEINGIWFYAPAERASIAELLQHLIAASPPGETSAAAGASADTAAADESATDAATSEQRGRGDRAGRRRVDAAAEGDGELFGQRGRGERP